MAEETDLAKPFHMTDEFKKLSSEKQQAWLKNVEEARKSRIKEIAPPEPTLLEPTTLQSPTETFTESKIQQTRSYGVSSKNKTEGINYSTLTGRATTGQYEDTGKYTTATGKDGLPMLIPVSDTPKSFREAMGETVWSGGGPLGPNDAWTSGPEYIPGTEAYKHLHGEDMRETTIPDYKTPPILSSQSSSENIQQNVPQSMESIYSNRMTASAADLQTLQSQIMQSEQNALQQLGIGNQQSPVVNNVTNNSSAPASGGGQSIISPGKDYFTRMKDDSMSIPRWRSKIG